MSSTSNSEVVLMVQFDLHPEHKNDFLRDLGAVVQEVKDNEPHTLAYQVYTDHSNPNTVYIYERYVNEHAWHVIHEHSAPFLRLFEPSNFKRLVKDIQVKQMSETGLGFVSR